MAKRGPKNVERGEKFKRALPCPINPAKADKKAKEIVDVLTEINVQKEKAKPYRDKVKELTLKVESLRHDITSKTEEREVTCVEERDFTHREVRVIRLDTDEVVESRTMTDEDRQEEMEDLAAPGERKPGKVVPIKGDKPETGAGGSEDGNGDEPPN